MSRRILACGRLRAQHPLLELAACQKCPKRRIQPHLSVVPWTLVIARFGHAFLRPAQQHTAANQVRDHGDSRIPYRGTDAVFHQYVDQGIALCDLVAPHKLDDLLFELCDDGKEERRH
ncbi:uncharacterized protein PG986_008091 [Apiospora aurea]|uniref:Uncharacterized protein n=1 Tax=Apiospora aurea TaxID=335848 RepID=A0ABR1QEF2_9PEZI